MKYQSSEVQADENITLTSLEKEMSFHLKLSLGNDHVRIYRLLFLPLKLVVNCQIASLN